MPRYRMTIEATIYATISREIEAEDEDEAREEAYNIVQDALARGDAVNALSEFDIEDIEVVEV